MAIKEPRAAIADIPDEVEILVEISLPNDHLLDGLAAFAVNTEIFNEILYINAEFNDK